MKRSFSKKRWRTRIVIALIAAIAIATYALVNPSNSAFIPKCPFKILTGLSCPGCGIQRAIHAATEGHFSEALSYNYFLVVSLPYLLALVLEKWILPSKWSAKLYPILYNRLLVLSFFFLTIAWWILRNILQI